MKVDTYLLKSEHDLTTFEFVSDGPKGAIKKRIQFEETAVPGIYNLAFGDKGPNGDLDDLAVSNNGDMEKVLGTVVTAIYLFLSKHPKRASMLRAAPRLGLGFIGGALLATMMR